MTNFTKTYSRARSQALLMSLILSLTIISCVSKPKPINSISNTSNTTSVATKAIDPNQLQLGKTIERELAGGDIHFYTLKLEANQYVNAVVEQKGIDVVLRFIDSKGNKIIEVDSPNGIQGDEPLKLITPYESTYKLEIASLETNAQAGHYQIKELELRAATAKDQALIGLYNL
ncbi:MAG: enterochelin esterase, partial [bacterium]